MLGKLRTSLFFRRFWSVGKPNGTRRCFEMAAESDLVRFYLGCAVRRPGVPLASHPARGQLAEHLRTAAEAFGT